MTPSSSTTTPPAQVGSDLSILVSQPYRYGFVTDIETEKIAKGLDEDVVEEEGVIEKLSNYRCGLEFLGL